MRFRKLTGFRAESSEIRLKDDLGMSDSVDWQEYEYYLDIDCIMSVEPGFYKEEETKIYLKNGDTVVTKESVDYILDLLSSNNTEIVIK